MMTYHLKLAEAESGDFIKTPAYEEHRSMLKQQLENERVIINGETVDLYGQEAETKKEKEEASASETPEEKEKRLRAMATEGYEPQIFMVWNAVDEREPHDFLMRDSLYQNGYVRDWTIQELDLVHAERDDELVLRQPFR